MGILLAFAADTYVLHILRLEASESACAKALGEEAEGSRSKVMVGLILGGSFLDRCTDDCPVDRRCSPYQAGEFTRIVNESSKKNRLVIPLNEKTSAELDAALDEHELNRIVLMGEFTDTDLDVIKNLIKKGTHVGVISNLFFDTEGKSLSVTDTFGREFRSFTPSSVF